MTRRQRQMALLASLNRIAREWEAYRLMYGDQDGTYSVRYILPVGERTFRSADDVRRFAAKVAKS